MPHVRRSIATSMGTARQLTLRVWLRLMTVFINCLHLLLRNMGRIMTLPSVGFQDRLYDFQTSALIFTPWLISDDTRMMFTAMQCLVVPRRCHISGRGLFLFWEPGERGQIDRTPASRRTSTQLDSTCFSQSHDAVLSLHHYCRPRCFRQHRHRRDSHRASQQLVSSVISPK